mmetsp:Transcript_19893/g.25803  ORF Transcript_19893/g.25803 Transcript_19893/m.25803 type:complete len:226 (+) Transcript_19893:102-779(+)
MEDEAESVRETTEKPLEKQFSTAKILVVVNRFVLETSSFLNRLCFHVEEELRKHTNQVRRIESNLEILEAKLASIPTTNEAIENNLNVSQHQSASEKPVETSPQNVETTSKEISFSIEKEKKPIPEPQIASIGLGEEYSKYVKLHKLGMPLEHVKLKAEAEGLDSAPLSALDIPQNLNTTNPLDQEPDPEIQVYLKMVQIGVPLSNVKQKMKMEGHDPSRLQGFE